jgi:hypothetical protein
MFICANKLNFICKPISIKKYKTSMFFYLFWQEIIMMQQGSGVIARPKSIVRFF